MQDNIQCLCNDNANDQLECKILDPLYASPHHISVQLRERSTHMRVPMRPIPEEMQSVQVRECLLSYTCAHLPPISGEAEFLARDHSQVTNRF